MKNHQNKYPYNRDKYQDSTSPKADAIGRFINEVLQEFVVVSALGVSSLIKSLFSWHAILVIPILSGLGYYSWWATGEALHIKFIHELDPELFTYERLMWMYDYHHVYHSIIFFLLIMFPIVLLLGMYARSVRTKFKKLFLQITLTNGLGDTPKLIRSRRLDKYRKQYIFDSNGIGLTEFHAKLERLESHFKKNVEMIKHGENKGQIVITLNKNDFPKKITFQEISEQIVLPLESFYIGQSVEGIITQKVAELPHMLIAGTTGSGKSIFFKQALMGLLESCPHLQIYLIDLKGGLEMIDFVKAPNVKVIKTMEDAVKTLSQVEKEMKDRFDYLEKNGLKQIIPAKDHMDRIIVAVDESSVLYMNRSKHDPDYEQAVAARYLADSISKLSRAAAINLLLATQKLDRQVIPTSVSENISGRMAFRANSLQGSLVVLGTKDAMELPEIPGRGIWNFGTKKMIVQAPFIDEETIKKRCNHLAKEFKSGKRKLLQPLVGTLEKNKIKGKLGLDPTLT